MSAEFVHLHNHSDYSLLDGAQTVQTLVNTIDDLKMDAVALTEHGNMFSAVNFYNNANKTGVKPIIGSEVYVAVNNRFDKKPRAEGGWGNNHLILLAQNYTGYKNLMKLISLGYLEGFYYRPRIDKDILREFSDGLICLSACLKGEVPEKLVNGDWEGAKQSALEFAEIFPDRYYLEVQNHGIEHEQVNVDKMQKLSKELNLPLVATNDAHYAKHDHWEAHDIHICLGTGKERNDVNRLRYATPEFYFKSQDEMHKLFKSVPQAIENTRLIADSIDLSIPTGEYHLPNFPLPPDKDFTDPDEYLKTLCSNGINEKYGDLTPELKKRIDHELSVIKKMGFSGYFLITQDFVKYAHDNNIPVGPGRGSAAGSIVSYALGITDIDPIKHNLIFERFLNEDRISMPDIDIDFCIERRGEVIDYIKNQYGENSVTQIITFGKMKAKQVVRDVGRVMGYSFGDVDRVAKAIPNELNITLEKALAKSADLQTMANGEYKELIEFSKVLEGMNRHASIHAAGVVVTPGELTDYMPLYKSSQGDVTSQYDMKNLENLGLLKMDFLGLRNLTVINHTLNMLNKKNVSVDIRNIPMDDPKVYQLFSKGLTIGVFQFESAGMREFLKKLKPTQFEDLIAMNALYRPGPMQNIDKFINRKSTKKKIKYISPLLKPILDETYGIIVYQEQVMQIVNEIANFTLAQADILRRAIGKKDNEQMEALKVKFIEGASNNGISEKNAKDIYNLIEKFAQYGFNKSHSTAYSYIAYQTAWLKTYYPAEFMAANLTSEMTNIDRVVILINECRKMNIDIHPPDINVSDIHFQPMDEKTISFGLNAIKNVGIKALEQIVIARDNDGPFISLFDFTSRVELQAVNKKVLESLIMSGTMDHIDGSRAEKFSTIDTAIRYGQNVQSDKNKNQVDLFGSTSNSPGISMMPKLQEVRPWSDKESLDNEKEVLGLYLTGHPLLEFADDLEDFSNHDFSEKINSTINKKVRIGGLIQNLKIHYDRKNNQMAFFTLECLGGRAEILVFSKTYSKYKDIIFEDNILFITGKPTDDYDFSDLKLVAEEIVPLAKVRDYYAKRVNVFLDFINMDNKQIEALHEISKLYPGKCNLMFHYKDYNNRKKRILSHNIRVSSSREYLTKLRDKCGKNNVWVE